MNWLKLQGVVWAVVLVVSNLHCQLACAAEPCHDSSGSSQSKNDDNLPPCHKNHQPPKQSEAPQSCSHAPLLSEYLVAADGKAELASTGSVIVLPKHAVCLLVFEQAQESITQEPSPPLSSELVLTSVLRI